jgi:hypothetical protein
MPYRLVDAVSVPHLQDQDKESILGNLNYHRVVPLSKPVVGPRRDGEGRETGPTRVTGPALGCAWLQ